MKDSILTLTTFLSCLFYGVVQCFDDLRDTVVLEDSEILITLNGTNYLQNSVIPNPNSGCVRCMKTDPALNKILKVR